MNIQSRGVTSIGFEAPDQPLESRRSGEQATRAEPAWLEPAHHARLCAMLRDYFPLVWRTVRRLGLSAARADEAAQDVFITVSKKLELIAPGAERTYLISVAIRMAANYRRAASERRERTVSLLELPWADPAPPADELLEQKRRRAVLDDALEQLPLPFRTVFVLYELEGMSGREIAELFQVPVGTAASRLRKARELFEAALKRIQARHSYHGVRP